MRLSSIYGLHGDDAKHSRCYTNASDDEWIPTNYVKVPKKAKLP
jgi:hypothetical protein